MRGWLRSAAGGLPRQFWFLWTGTLVNRLGSFVVIFMAIYLTGERHFSQSQAGLAIGLYGVGGAIGTTVGGVLADRWGRRPTMLTAQFGAAALTLALGFAHSYGQIAVNVLLLGLFAEAARPAFQAMMVDVVPDRDRIRAYSLNYWAINLGFAFSSIGAGLAAKANYFLLFAIDGATTLITAIISMIFLAETRPAKVKVQDEVKGRVRTREQGLGAALRDRVFLGYLLLTLGSVLVVMQHMSTLPIAMTSDGLSPATYGGVIAINGVLIVLGQLFVPKLIGDFDPARVLGVGALIMGVGFGVLAFAGDLWLYALSVIIWTLGEMIQSPSNATTVASLAPRAMRGRYQGLNSLAWSAGTALAPTLGGLTQEHFGSAALWIACFGLSVVVAAGNFLARPSRARRARAAEPLEPVVPPPAVAEPAADAPIHVQ